MYASLNRPIEFYHGWHCHSMEKSHFFMEISLICLICSHFLLILNIKSEILNYLSDKGSNL